MAARRDPHPACNEIGFGTQTRKLRAVGAELVGGIAHEFNNLLTPVMLKISKIQITRHADQQLQEDMAVVTQATQRAGQS